MPLRKPDRRTPSDQPMTEIRMSAASTTTSLYEKADGWNDAPPSAYPVYGAWRHADGAAQQPPLTPRPRLNHLDTKTLADLMTESTQASPLETPHSHIPPFAPGAAFSHSEAGTRSSSPYPGASPHPASTPFRSQETLRPLVPDASPTYLRRDWVKEGSIARLESRDDKELLFGWKRALYHYVTPVLALVSLAVYWLYFGLRITFVISAQRHYNAPFPLAWIFIAIEISVAFPIFLNTLWSLWILKKRYRPKLRLIGNDVPTIDVFITCCGEDDDLILDTVRAALDVDYPYDRFRVILLDDGKSDPLRDTLHEMRETHTNLHYMRRPKFPGVPHHFKAGNLNYGLDESHNLPGGAAEFMAALDADMIPEQNWLRAVVPHLLLDERVGLACPPQLFYNVPTDDPLCQSLDFFVSVAEPVKDALGVAWCTGSGYVVRREALDQIGNFPCGSLAEDVATSTLLLGRGWKTAYVHEPLQFGTVPEDYGSHLKQRTRWAVGTVDTAFKLRFCLWGEKIRHMTFAQRASGFIYAFLSLFNVFLCFSLFAMPIVLIANKPLVAYANEEQLRWLIRACFATVICNRLCEFALFLPSGYATGQRGSRAQLWMSPYIALTIIRSFMLPKWLGGQAQAFKPTGSIQSALNERFPRKRAPMYKRIWTICVNYLAGFHVAYVYFVLVAVSLSTYRCFLQHGVRAKLVCLLTHAFWPPCVWVMVVSSFWLPFQYACDPPSVPDREELLDRDPKTGIAHPKASSKKTGYAAQTFLFEAEYSFTTVLTTVVFVAAFFY